MSANELESVYQAAISDAATSITRRLKDRGVCLVGVSGRLQHGKSTVGEMLRESLVLLFGDHAVCVIAFADILKAALELIFSLTRDQLHSAEGKATVDERWKLTPRVLAQVFGTEAMRRAFGPDIWIAAAYNSVPETAEIVIVTDVRFTSEARSIVDADGLLMRVICHNKLPAPGVWEHASENDLDTFDWLADQIVPNDGTLDELGDCVRGTWVPRICERVAKLKAAVSSRAFSLV